MQFDWDPKKNEVLKRNGRPSFEDAVKAIAQPGAVIADRGNDSHPEQRMFLVWISDRIYKVAYEMRGEVVRLITLHRFNKKKQNTR